MKDAAGAPEEAPPPEREPGSFRDRNGRVYYQNGRVLRSLSPRACANWRRLQETAFFVRRVGDGSIVATTDRGPLPTAAGSWSTRASPSCPIPTNGPSGC